MIKKSSEKCISEDEILFPLPKQSEEPEGICKDSLYQIHRNAKKWKEPEQLPRLSRISSHQSENRWEIPKMQSVHPTSQEIQKIIQSYWQETKIPTIDHQGNKALIRAQESLYSK